MPNTINTAFTQIRRTPYQALAAVMVLALTFFAATIFTFLFFGINKVLHYFESSPQVIAFFEKGEDLKDEDVANIKRQLSDTGKMASFKYVSTREAEAIYKEKNKEDPLLLELVDYKILPPSIEISATDINDLGNLKEILAKQPKVTDVVFYEDIVNTLSVWVNNLRLGGLILLGYLIIQSVLILMLIVSLKILAKREEIEIMRLLGASFWFIAGAFICEGAIYGLVGAVLGFIIATSFLFYSTPLLSGWLGDISVLPAPSLFLIQVFSIDIFAGIILGIVASVIGVKRFIRS